MPYYLVRTDDVPRDLEEHYTPGDYVEFWGECIAEVKLCEGCGKHRCDMVEWCSKFRHKASGKGFCAWPDDSEVK